MIKNNHYQRQSIRITGKKRKRKNEKRDEKNKEGEEIKNKQRKEKKCEQNILVRDITIIIITWNCVQGRRKNTNEG